MREISISVVASKVFKIEVLEEKAGGKDFIFVLADLPEEAKETIAKLGIDSRYKLVAMLNGNNKCYCFTVGGRMPLTWNYVAEKLELLDVNEADAFTKILAHHLERTAVCSNDYQFGKENNSGS